MQNSRRLIIGINSGVAFFFAAFAAFLASGAKTLADEFPTSRDTGDGKNYRFS